MMKAKNFNEAKITMIKIMAMYPENEFIQMINSEITEDNYKNVLPFVQEEIDSLTANF